jgi:hypothetical protein
VRAFFDVRDRAREQHRALVHRARADFSRNTIIIVCLSSNALE